MILNPVPGRSAEQGTDLTHLLNQLKAVQEIAKQGFWLSEAELIDLLELDPVDLQPQAEPAPIPQFEWRNFICQRIGNRGGVEYWQIRERHPISHRKLQIAAQPQSSLTQEPVQPALFVQLDSFWNSEEVESLLEFVFNSQSQFYATHVTTGEDDYRRSAMIPRALFADFADLMEERIQERLPEIFSRLGFSPFSIAEIEAQLTSHNDGHFYKIHNDNGSAETATRELTYVYYFHGQPQGFSGGQLKIYDTVIRQGQYQAAETNHLVEPRYNSIVFFPSYHLHEVLPVHCPSQRFEDGRFTINGWIRRHSVQTPTPTQFRPPSPSSAWITSLLGDF